VTVASDEDIDASGERYGIVFEVTEMCAREPVYAH